MRIGKLTITKPTKSFKEYYANQAELGKKIDDKLIKTKYYALKGIKVAYFISFIINSIIKYLIVIPLTWIYNQVVNKWKKYKRKSKELSNSQPTKPLL